jgi:hypothetical protein
MSWLKLSFLCALLLVPVLSGYADEKKDKKDKDKSTEEAKAASDEAKENAMLDSLPANQVYNGVHIPNYGPDGKLLMLFDAKSAKRVTDREIEMQDLQIEIHNKDGTTFKVQMAHSLFNLDNRVLTSDTPTTIKRDDFVINGDRAEFHTKTRFGRVFGNVKMVINSGDTK